MTHFKPVFTFWQYRSKNTKNTLIIKQNAEYIAANYTELLTLSDVAAVANLSNYHFCCFFKRMSGQTFVQYLTDVRLSHAEKFLRCNEFKIIKVAKKSGFSSIKTFNQIFKKKYGISPSSYRQIHKGQKSQTITDSANSFYYID